MRCKLTARSLIAVGSILLGAVSITQEASAFCGFYVAKAGTKLFNKASKVVLVRHDNKIVITMANDYRGDLKQFAIVIPVPKVLKRGQINVTNNALVNHVDAYTAPRLVEYFDRDPCRMRMMEMRRKSMTGADRLQPNTSPKKSAKSLGVKIEATYSVGEYSILILSAKQSGGLQTWLDQEGYKVPAKARKVLAHYISAGMKFFVAKVNLKAQTKLGFSYLRPLQIAFESKKFMLPIRLGMLNAKDEQELFVFAITRNGRVEASNYRNVKIPSNFDVPIYVKSEFGDFYKSMFRTIAKREGSGAIFLEYAWNMAWCDPCAANPLSPAQLRQLGVFWLNYEKVRPGFMKKPGLRWVPGAQVYITRLHMRYTAATHPDDIRFVETANKRNYQGRYILRHPYTGPARCSYAARYFRSLPRRFEREARNLARATGWDINAIRAKMEKSGQSFRVRFGSFSPNRKWWERIWQNR